jgi:hypothetical protein
MSTNDKISVKEIIVGVVVLAVIGAAMYYTLGLLSAEGGKKVDDISQAGDKAANHVETHVKLVSIDPIKGDTTARFEFEPSPGLVSEDNTLKQDLKLYLNAGTGKQEIDFPKGKLMTPVEGVFNMHDGQATDYPFDKYVADIDVYIYAAPAKTDEKKKQEAEPKPAAGENAPATEPKSEKEPDDMAISVDFVGSIPGYNITASKAKYTEIDYVGIETKIERSGTVKFFSIFVSVLMWALAIGVLFFVGAIVLRGRKIEVGMFSFFGALLFAFYAVRNSQPNVPPIGAYCDFISFFWAEALIAACLVVALVTWILRPTK